MKVIHADNYSIKGFKNWENSVFFIEGIEKYMILYYNYTTKNFVLTPVSYFGKAKNIDEILEEIESNVSLINRLRIKSNRCGTVWEFQLGKARFYKSVYSEEERIFYLEQLKKSLLRVNDRHIDNTKPHLYGYAEFDDDIWDFIGNLGEIDKNTLAKPKSKQLEIPNSCYTETI